MKDKIIKNVTIQNLTELLKTSDMTIAQTLLSVLRPKYYNLKDVYFASDKQISNAVENHLKELKINDDKVTEEELNYFFFKNSNK